MLTYKFLKIILILFLNRPLYCESILTNVQQNFIRSLNSELNVKHMSIVTDHFFQIDLSIFDFVKKLSSLRIFTSCLTVIEMSNSMTEYYETYNEYWKGDLFKQNYELKRRKGFKVLPSKISVMLYGNHVENIFKKFFTEKNELAVSKYIWFIFADDITGNQYSKDIYIPYDCEFFIIHKSLNKNDSFVMKETYHPSISSSVPFSHYFGTWEVNKGFDIDNRDFYARRFDMNQTILYFSAEYFNQDYDALKICVELIYELSTTMNFDLVYASSKNADEENERDTVQEEIYLGLFLIDYASFYPFIIGPMYKKEHYFFIRHHSNYENHGIMPFLRPFSFNMWMAVVSWIVLSGTILSAMFFLTNKKSSRSVVLTDCLFEAIDCFLNQCGNDNISSTPLKIMRIATRIIALFLVPAFAGAVLSFILIPAVKFPFTNFKEFVEDGSYKLGYGKSLLLDETAKWSDDQWLKKASQNFSIGLDGGPVEAVKIGKNKLCLDHKFVLLAVDFNFKKEGCQIIKSPSPVFFTWVVMLLRPESPYRAIFNRLIKSFRSSGMNRVLAKVDYEEELVYLLGSEQLNDFSAVPLANLLTIFITVGIFYVISAGILLAEIYWHKKKRNTPAGFNHFQKLHSDHLLGNRMKFDLADYRSQESYIRSRSCPL